MEAVDHEQADVAASELLAQEPEAQLPHRGYAWWPGIALALFCLLAAVPAAGGDGPALGVLGITAAAVLVAGRQQLGALAPPVAGLAVIGLLIWFERFDDSPGAAIAAAVAAAVAAVASAMLARRSARLEAWVAELRDQLHRERASGLVDAVLRGNSRHDLLTRELARAKRYERPLGVSVLVVDNVELLRRQSGEDAALQAQMQLARVIARQGRVTDGAFTSGDVIVLALPETDVAGARILTERIRLAFGALGLVGADDITLTASCGVSAYPGDGDSSDGLLDAGRAALKAAIARGGNRTIVSAAATVGPRGWHDQPAKG